MNCLAVMETGNYALSLVKELEEAGIAAQVVSTPCKLSHEGCGYSVRFDLRDKEEILRVASRNDVRVKSVYMINKDRLHSRYHKIQ